MCRWFVFQPSTRYKDVCWLHLFHWKQCFFVSYWLQIYFCWFFGIYSQKPTIILNWTRKFLIYRLKLALVCQFTLVFECWLVEFKTVRNHFCWSLIRQLLINFASGSTPNCTYILQPKTHQEMIPYTCFISINAASRQRVNLNLGFVDINGRDLRLQPGNASASVVSCDVNDTIVSCTVSVAAAGEPSGINCSVFMDVPRAKSVYESVKCLRSGDGKTHIYYMCCDNTAACNCC